jgi:hypothetical protein
MREVELPKANLDELISYAKQKESPSVTIIDGIKGDDIDEIMIIAKRLRLILFAVDESKEICDKIAVLSNVNIAKHMAEKLEKRCQIMYCDFAKRPRGSITIAAMTNFASGWDIIRDNGFVVRAFDAEGNEIPEFIHTDIQEVNCDRLVDLRVQTYKAHISIGNSGGRHYDDLLRYSRHYFVNDGIFNEARHCYYPSGDSVQEIADRNKIEKLFRKWGHKRLPVTPGVSG